MAVAPPGSGTNALTNVCPFISAALPAGLYRISVDPLLWATIRPKEVFSSSVGLVDVAVPIHPMSPTSHLSIEQKKKERGKSLYQWLILIRVSQNVAFQA